MKKLKVDYYLSVNSYGELIGRFEKYEDAFNALPTSFRCFAPPVHKGNVFYIDKNCTDVFKTEEFVNVFESLNEFFNSNEVELSK